MIDPEFLCMRCMSELPSPRCVCPHCGFDNASAHNEAHQLECGSILAGTYLIGRVLGQGGFGITYIGWDLNLDIKVAIKEYYPEGCVTRDTHTHVSVLTYAGEKETYFQKGKERFVNEAKTLAKFSGDGCVVGVRAFFYENGTAYIVMDFVEGETLKSYVARRGGKLPSAEVLELFKPLFRSLARVHEMGLLHRDISPDNIMLRPDGTLALLDFGAARQMSVAGEHSNTINVKHGFAPEEQYRTRGEQGPWTDVYALCATIYRLTTGVTPPQALDRLTDEALLTPPNRLGADFTPAQEQAVVHGLAVRAADRTQTVRRLEEELSAGGQRAYGKQAKPASPADTAKANPAGSRKRPIWIGAIAGGVVVAAILLIVALTGAKQERTQEASSFGSAESSTGGAIVSQETASPLQSADPTPDAEEPFQVFPLSRPARIDASQQDALFQQALALLEAGERERALTVYDFSQRISADCINSAVLLEDDTMLASYNDSSIAESWEHLGPGVAVELGGEFVLHSNGTVSYWCSDLYWQDIVAIDSGAWHVVALRMDGTAVAYADPDPDDGRCDVDGWTDLAAVAAGSYHTVGLKADGTVVAVGSGDSGECDVESWTDIAAISAGAFYTAGLKTDGTVVTTNPDRYDTASWSGIVAISAGDWHLTALKADGTVLATGENSDDQCDVKSWTDIVAISAGDGFTIGVEQDGTVVATGSNNYMQYELIKGKKLW